MGKDSSMSVVTKINLEQKAREDRIKEVEKKLSDPEITGALMRAAEQGANFLPKK